MIAILSHTTDIAGAYVSFESMVKLKCHYDENCIFSIKTISKNKQVACMRRKIISTFFKHLSLFQRYSSLKYAN